MNGYPPDPAAGGMGCSGAVPFSRVRRRFPRGCRSGMTWPGDTAYGAPQIDVPVRLNTNENPYPPSPGAGPGDHAGRRGVWPGTLNRYPDRDAVALARRPGRLPRPWARVADRVWAANGSNGVIQRLLQAFGGPGRTALGFEPSYSMHPLTRGHRHPWVSGARDADFGLEPDHAVAAIRVHQPDLVFLTSPNNPTGAALPPG